MPTKPGRPRKRPLPSLHQQTQINLRKLAKAHKNDPTIPGVCTLIIRQIENLQRHIRDGHTAAADRIRKNMEMSQRALSKMLMAAANQ